MREPTRRMIAACCVGKGQARAKKKVGWGVGTIGLKHYPQGLTCVVVRLPLLLLPLSAGLTPLRRADEVSHRRLLAPLPPPLPPLLLLVSSSGAFAFLPLNQVMSLRFSLVSESTPPKHFREQFPTLLRLPANPRKPQPQPQPSTPSSHEPER